MPEIVYILCAVTSIVCAVLLVRSYLRIRLGLLLWASLCFTGLALNNLIVLADVAIGPSVDLQLVRNLTALASVLCLVWGFVSESK